MSTKTINDLSSVRNDTFQADEVVAFVRKPVAQGLVYRELIQGFVSNHLQGVETPHHSICEYRGHGDVHCDPSSVDLQRVTPTELGIVTHAIDVPDVLLRERLFRGSVRLNFAHEQIMKAAVWWVRYYTKHSNVRLIITQMVDNYVMDTMVRVGAAMNVQVIGIVKFFFPGRIRLTTYGETTYWDSASPVEVESLKTKIRTKAKTVFTMDKRTSRSRKVRERIAWLAKYGYHYLWKHQIRGEKAYDYACVPHAKPPYRIHKAVAKAVDVNTLASLTGPKVYVPLHYYPEATTEYWCNELSSALYYPSLVESIAKMLEQGFQVICKEHPAMVGLRPGMIYRMLGDMEGVHFVDPFASAYDVMEHCELVAVWTGTSGIEASVIGKRVAVLSSAYYQQPGHGTLQHLDQTQALSEVEVTEMLSELLAGTVAV